VSGIRLTFWGAAGEVTGSMHLLEAAGGRFLLDAGLFQGRRAEAARKNAELPFDPRRIDAIILSHAHIDHAGRLPLLVRHGFHGPIYATPASRDLCAIMLPDSAHIQMKDAEYLARRGKTLGVESQPLYNLADAIAVQDLIVGQPYRRINHLRKHLAFEFTDAGHILGSASVNIRITEDGGHRLVFSGDIGRKNLPILRDPEPIPPCDVLITESTYGDRIHDERVDMMDALARIIEEELHDGGRVIVPAFSVGRTQSVVMFLGKLMREGRLPELPIHVDSPMSREATKIMSRHPELFDADTRALIASGHSPFFFDGVHYVADVEESKALNQERSGVIVSASGMCEAGRVLHHLAQSIGRKQDCVLMVGYQAQGTLGRKLLDGHRTVNIFGEAYDVNCKVRSMSGLSAHADWRELMANARPVADKCRQAFVVHGEDEAAEAYATRLREAGFREVVVPSKGDRHEIR